MEQRDPHLQPSTRWPGVACDSSGRMPRRLLEDPIPSGPGKGHVHRLPEMLPQYYKERGWDEKGLPTEEKLAQLEIA